MQRGERTRWIVVALVDVGVFVQILNGGYPGGLRFYWNGRRYAFQPTEFLSWEHGYAAVEKRLERAGLECLEFAWGEERVHGWVPLIAKVRRREGGKQNRGEQMVDPYTRAEVKAMNFEEAKAALHNQMTYAARVFELLASTGKIEGDGFEIGQNVAACALRELEARWVENRGEKLGTRD